MAKSLALDLRVTALETGGECGGACNTTEIEDRLDTLEDKVSDLEARTDKNEGEIEGKISLLDI